MRRFESAQAVIDVRLNTVSPADPLRRFLEQEGEANALLGTLRMYVARAHLCSGDTVPEEALELLSRVVIEALNHADRFDPSRQPRAWLLGIAANIIRREQVDRAKRARREPTITFIYSKTDKARETLSEDDMFDRISTLANIGLEQELDANDEAKTLLALVPEDDRQVLRLALLHDLDSGAVGKVLGISAGTARVRLHRAINRLRDAYHRRATSIEEGEAHE